MKNKIQFVLCLLFGLMFINSGLNKIFNYLPVPKDLPEAMLSAMGAIMQIKWLLPLIAVAEIISGVLFITKKYRPLAAVMIFPVMVGILLTHITIAPSGLPIILILFAIEIWVIIDNKEKFLPMIR